MGKGMKQRPFDFKDMFLGRDSHINLKYHGENSDSEECIFSVYMKPILKEYEFC